MLTMVDGRVLGMPILPFFLELMGLDYCKVLMCQSGV